MMMKNSFLWLLFAIFLSACGGTNSSFGEDQGTNTSIQAQTLTGFNVNWSFLPPLSDQMISATASLQPKLLRFPGGTVSKYWDWQSGSSTKNPNSQHHSLDDLKALKDGSGADVIFVLNTINSDLETQLEMLRTARDMGIAVKFIEMGNEHYLGKGNNADDSGKHQDNVRAFPTGKEYAGFVNRWAAAIKDEFPEAKIGISMLGRSSNNERLKTWNDLIVENIKPAIFDAYVYHIYVHAEEADNPDAAEIDSIINARTAVLESMMVDDNSKQIWITEYGVHASSLQDTIRMTEKLADYVESLADVSLPQVLYRKSPDYFPNVSKKYFSMLSSPDGKGLTLLGEMYKSRVQN